METKNWIDGIEIINRIELHLKMAFCLILTHYHFKPHPHPILSECRYRNWSFCHCNRHRYTHLTTMLEQISVWQGYITVCLILCAW